MNPLAAKDFWATADTFMSNHVNLGNGIVIPLYYFIIAGAIVLIGIIYYVIKKLRDESSRSTSDCNKEESEKVIDLQFPLENAGSY